MNTMTAKEFREWLVKRAFAWEGETSEAPVAEQLPKREWIDDFIGWLDQHGND